MRYVFTIHCVLMYVYQVTRSVRLLGHIDVFADDDELMTDTDGGGSVGGIDSEDFCSLHQRYRHIVVIIIFIRHQGRKVQCCEVVTWRQFL